MALPKVTEKFDLSDEEAMEALQKAQQVKNAIRHREAYQKKMKEDRVFKPPTSGQLQQRFEKVYGQSYGKFEYNDHNREIMRMLFLYFSDSPDFEKIDEKYSLKKGLLLQGPFGCGKTSVLKSMQLLVERRYGMISCKKIEESYDRGGFHDIEKYTQTSISHNNLTTGWMFDDFGWEDAGKHYAKQTNVMENVLATIELNGIFSHFHLTTNLSMEEIAEKYGGRIRDRIRAMFNQVKFDTSTPSMRS